VSGLPVNLNLPPAGFTYGPIPSKIHLDPPKYNTNSFPQLSSPVTYAEMKDIDDDMKGPKNMKDIRSKRTARQIYPPIEELGVDVDTMSVSGDSQSDISTKNLETTEDSKQWNNSNSSLPTEIPARSRNFSELFPASTSAPVASSPYRATVDVVPSDSNKIQSSGSWTIGSKRLFHTNDAIPRFANTSFSPPSHTMNSFREKDSIPSSSLTPTTPTDEKAIRQPLQPYSGSFRLETGNIQTNTPTENFESMPTLPIRPTLLPITQNYLSQWEKFQHSTLQIRSENTPPRPTVPPTPENLKSPSNPPPTIPPAVKKCDRCEQENAALNCTECTTDLCLPCSKIVHIGKWANHKFQLL
jgi:hypothetical protein